MKSLHYIFRGTTFSEKKAERTIFSLPITNMYQSLFVKDLESWSNADEIVLLHFLFFFIK